MDDFPLTHDPNESELWHEHGFDGHDPDEPQNVEDAILRDFGGSATDKRGRGKLGGHYRPDPYTQWGKTLVAKPPLAAGPQVARVREFLVAELPEPCAVTVRLSATSDTAPAAGFTVTWTLLIGLGSSLQQRQWQVPVAPTIGVPGDDIIVTFPVHVLRVSAVVTQTGGGGRIIVCAQVAPVFAQGAGAEHDTTKGILTRIAQMIDQRLP